MKYILALVLGLSFVGAGYAAHIHMGKGSIIVQAASGQLTLQQMKTMDHMNKWCLQQAQKLWVWRQKTFKNKQNPTPTMEDQKSIYRDGGWCNTSANEALRIFVQGLKENYGKDMADGPIKHQ